MDLTFARTTEWWLELPSEVRAESWRQSQLNATPGNVWNVYLNLICLNAVLDAIQAEHNMEANVWLGNARTYPLWEFVNGTAITVGDTRLILIPTEAIDDGELEVPQEWVDIPSWVGDYYLAVQVDPEADWARVWGYTTHRQLKTKGSYDLRDRTYCMDAGDLKQDLNAFWVTHQLCRGEQTRAETVPLQELPVAQSENLIQRLGSSAIAFPRLAVPFDMWGALIANVEWRQQLYQHRLGNVVPVIVRLSEWLQGRFETVWQTIEEILSPQQVATEWRSGTERQLTNQFQNSAFEINRVKVLDFGSQPGSEQVALLVGIGPVTETEVSIGIQIRPIGDRVYLPNEVRVRLLDENGNELGQASAAITEVIQLQFGGQKEERFSIEVTCGDKSITESFVI